MINLIIITSNVVSGAEIVLVDYLKNTNKKFLLLVNEEISENIIFKNKNITIEKLKLYSEERNRKLMKLLNIIKVYIKTNSLIKSYKIKNVVANNINDIWYLLYLKKVKKIAIVHEIVEKKSILLKKIELKQRELTKIIAVSNAVKIGLLKQGINNEKISVIYNGLKYKEYYEKKEIKHRYIFVGMLNENKNPKEFLNFIKVLKNKGLNPSGEIIYKYCNNEIFEDIKKEIKNYKLPIVLNKNLSRIEIEDRYREADYLFICSKREALPTVILESLNNSTPVIARNVGGISEILNEKNGYLYKNLFDLEKIIESLKVQNLNDYQLKCIQGNLLIKEKFTLSKKIEEMDNLFN